jgi:hypothetical protein
VSLILVITGSLLRISYTMGEAAGASDAAVVINQTTFGFAYDQGFSDGIEVMWNVTAPYVYENWFNQCSNGDERMCELIKKGRWPESATSIGAPKESQPYEVE